MPVHVQHLRPLTLGKPLNAQTASLGTLVRRDEDLRSGRSAVPQSTDAPGQAVPGDLRICAQPALSVPPCPRLPTCDGATVSPCRAAPLRAEADDIGERAYGTCLRDRSHGVSVGRLAGVPGPQATRPLWKTAGTARALAS